MKDMWIWLSHVTGMNTPGYGGATSGFQVIPDKQQSCGDSCNTVKLEMSNHIGTHVDAPRHFVNNGKCIEQFLPDSWIFNKPLLIDIQVDESEIISISHLDGAIDKSIKDADIVLIRTGIEKFRKDKYFWETPPGFSPELYEFFASRFKSFSAIAMDTISISSFAHRDVGRKAHDVFLSAGIRIFEDVALASIEKRVLNTVIALPFRFENSDGSPCTIIAKVTDS